LGDPPDRESTMLRALRTETDIVQSFIDFSLAWLDDRKYTLTIDADLGRWAGVMQTASTNTFVNPAFDPRHSRLTPHNSFWLEVRAGSYTVATCAARLLITHDFLDLMRTMKLWLETPRVSDGELHIAPPLGMPILRGKVGHEGGLWVHPEHRKRGLSAILPHLTRALAYRQWDIDWQTGIARRGIGECGILKSAYGVPHVELCFDGYFPLTQSDDRFFVAYMNRDELVAGLDLNAVATLLPDRHQQPRHTLALVKKG
jgi:hypothetical protein